MRYRVDELAERGGVSVDTVRFYQTKGLLPRPEREGRVAWYDDAHLERLERIRDLKDKGFTLEMVARLLAGELDPSEEALAVALTGPLPGEDGTGAQGELLDRDALAARTGVPATLLEVLEREGLLVPRRRGDARCYTAADASALSSGLRLLEAGLPLSELMELARRHNEAMRATAEHAVELFARFVLDPIRADAGSEGEAAERTVAALHDMLPAATALVTHHFGRMLLDAARARFEAEGRTPPAAGQAPEAD